MRCDSVLVVLMTALTLVKRLDCSESGRNTMVERLRADVVYRDALDVVGHNSTVIHKAGPETVFFAPSTRGVRSLSGAVFGGFNTSKSMERFFNSHTALVPDTKMFKNDQVIYNVLGRPLRLNEYYNKKERFNVTTVNGVEITDTLDAINDGSRIAVLPRVLIPATFTSILEAVKDVPNLTSFRQALIHTGLGEELDAMVSPITVFAPTNTALDCLPSTLLDDLPLLKETLWHNIIKGTLYSAGIFENGLVSLKDGTELVIIEGEGSVILTDMTIIDVDFPLMNGVLHVIDGIFTLPGLPELYYDEI